MLEFVGKICRKARRTNGKTQLEVAIDTGYSVANISEFERGHNNNAKILTWYIQLMSDTDIRIIKDYWKGKHNDI